MKFKFFLFTLVSVLLVSACSGKGGETTTVKPETEESILWKDYTLRNATFIGNGVVQIGVDLARKYKESREIVHAIEAHHGDVEPQTLVAMIVQAADAVSAARPGARRENLETYIKRLQKLEEIANSFKGIEKSFAIQAGREVRIMVKPDEVNDDEMVFIARDIAHKIESELEYPGQIKINVIREMRQVDYAK